MRRTAKININHADRDVKKRINMSKAKTTVMSIVITFLFIGCAKQPNKLDVNYLKEGNLCSETISIDFIDKDGKINSPYIDTIKFSYLDSISYPEMNPDRGVTYTRASPLDFSKKITPYSPEYYCTYTLYNIIKGIEYYNKLFENKIDFDFYKGYRNIEVTIGDAPYLTSPGIYIFEKNANPSPSLFFHEIGHRAFWYMQDPDGLGIKFKGLSIIHMGLLEYFTVSLNNSPIVLEDAIPDKLIRNAGLLHQYPLNDSFKLRHFLKLLEESCPVEIQNPQSNISKYLAASYAAYDDEILDNICDNHRGGMVLTATLWRIREKMEQKNTDKLVAQTILNLNKYMDKRPDFYSAEANEPLPDKIEWYDLFYGLIQKDKELFEGKDIQVIVSEFAKTGYPVDKVKY
ncbi:MAG: hypothetical protein LBU22_06975 [Dysgonamonadaceae bacterium]|jgi:hypothetical protein|nr:hypothetical protein [Dysgonamonadaceae bacterium]